MSIRRLGVVGLVSIAGWAGVIFGCGANAPKAAPLSPSPRVDASTEVNGDIDADFDGGDITDALAHVQSYLDSAAINIALAQRELADADAGDAGQHMAVASAQVAAAASAAQAFSNGKQSQNTEQSQAGRASSEKVELMNGTLEYGLTLALLQYSTSRQSSERAAARNYESGFKFVPTTVGFQFTYRGVGVPWNLQKSDETFFPLMSVGGMLLVTVDADAPSRGALSLGPTLSFFDNLIGVGIGFDLYRGIPVLGPGGAGTSTANTGVLAWAFSPHGEVTAENVFVAFTLGLDPIAKALSGKLK